MPWPLFEWPRISRRALLLHTALAFAAFVYAIPIASSAYEELLRVNQQARLRLIQHHRLWEVDLTVRSRPEAWTHMASRLLSDRQLLARLAIKSGGQSSEAEIEYRRDVTIARAEVVVKALGAWGTPVAGLYALIWVALRRRPVVAARPLPASALDPRYRPPQ